MSKLTAAALRRFLAAHAAYTFEPCMVGSCPIAAFLAAEQGAPAPFVSDHGWYVRNLPYTPTAHLTAEDIITLPRWACDFVNRIDCWPDKEITGERCLPILDAVITKHRPGADA